MKSKWEQHRPVAARMRRTGMSIRTIEQKLGIPHSTLSGWLKSVELSESKRTILKNKHRTSLAKARRHAAIRHVQMKQERTAMIHKSVRTQYTPTRLANVRLREVALAMLYVGEGSKTNTGLGLGNSNPKIVRFYIESLESLYGIDRAKFCLSLHLRADQDDVQLKRFWSKAVGMPLGSFRYTLRDKRTEGRPTYPHYKGVCFVRGGGVEIQRRLLYLAEVLCENV